MKKWYGVLGCLFVWFSLAGCATEVEPVGEDVKVSTEEQSLLDTCRRQCTSTAPCDTSCQIYGWSITCADYGVCAGCQGFCY